MMGLESIQALAREQGNRAKKYGILPIAIFPDDVLTAATFESRISIPFLGDYVPDGFTLEESVFVDKTGFGRNDEPAMSTARFLSWIREQLANVPVLYLAVIEEGEFQVYVGKFQKTRRNND